MNEAKTKLGHNILNPGDQGGKTAHLGRDRRDAWPFSNLDVRCLSETEEQTAALFGLDAAETALLRAIPYRGARPNAVPTDPRAS